jgi:hypothetical protein
MRKGISTGFIIFGIVLFALWAPVACLHFFKYSDNLPMEYWLEAFFLGQQNLSLMIEVYIAGGAFFLLSLIFLIPPVLRYSHNNSVRIIREWSVGLTLATALWVGVGFLSSLFISTIPKGIVEKIGEWYPALFYTLMDLAVLNYFLTFLFFMVSAAFGRAVIAKLWPAIDFTSRLQEFLFSAATGLGMMALAFFFLGQFKILYPWAVGGFILLAFFFSFWGARNFIPDMFRAVSENRLNGISLILFVVLLLLIISMLHYPLYPVHKHDATTYHLVAPETFIREHAISFHPYINFNSLPMGTELLYIPGLMLNRDVMTQITSFFFFLMCLGIVYEFGRSFLNSPVTGLLAAILVCLTPPFIHLSCTPYIDMALAFYISATVLALAGWLYGNYDRFYILTGLMAGFSLGVKYTSMVFLLIFVVWILVQRIFVHRIAFRNIITGTLLMLIVAAVVASPWYVRNIALFGNPVFPFYNDAFSNILGDGKLAELKPDLAIDQETMLDIFEYEGGIERILRFIPDLSFSAKFVRNPIGPLHIAILPFLLLLGIAGIGRHIAKYIFKWKTEIHYDIPVFMCVAIVLAYASYWIFFAELIHSRYFAPAIPFLSILGGYTLYNLLQVRLVKSTHMLTQTVLVAFGMLAVFYFNYGIIDLKISELPLSDKTRTEFVSEKISSWDAVMHMNNTMKLSRDYKVYGLGCEDARYYANFTLIGAPWGYADWRSFADAAKTGKGLHKFLSDYSCTYLLYDTTSIPYLKKYYATIKLPKDSTFDKYFTKVTHMEFTTIYKLNNVAPGVE